MTKFKLIFRSLLLIVLAYSKPHLIAQMFCVKNEKERRVFSSSIHFGYSDVNFGI